MTADLMIGVVSGAVGLATAAATGGAIYGLMRGKLDRLCADMRSVKESLGLELSGGEIKTAFVPRHEWETREAEVGDRICDLEVTTTEHGQRLAAAEARIDVGS